MDNALVGALLRRIATEDRDAFQTLYKAFSRRVYAYALNQVNDPARAEEIVSDTLFEVWRHPTRFRGESQFATWLIGIARNKVLMAYRGRRPDEDHDELDEVAENVAADTEDGFALIAGAQRREGVARCMSGLSAEHREALHLVFFEGMALGEVAEVQKIPYGTVQTRVHHAKLNIRKCLGRLLLSEGNPARRPA